MKERNLIPFTGFLGARHVLNVLGILETREGMRLPKLLPNYKI
ncbi:MAG: hypothetical protein ACOC6N_00705 [archaeon]